MGLTHLEHSLGITPAFLRIAYYYLCLGCGTYRPKNHPHYNKIIVRQLYEFTENPSKDGEFAGGLIVEFFNDNDLWKAIEFRCQVIGAKGTILLASVN